VPSTLGGEVRKDAEDKLARVLKELAQKRSEAEAIEKLIVRFHRTPGFELESAEVALLRDLAREKFKALLDEIDALKERERELKQKGKPKG
jgi:hypothetical protein